MSVELLDQLDEQWAKGGPGELVKLLGQVPAADNELAVELCAADLEWRWRTNRAKQNIESVLGSLPARPLAHDYQNLLADRCHNLDCQRNLLEAEWCARSVWGDAPDVDDFAAKMPMLADWNTHLAKELAALVPLEATLTSTSLTRPIHVRVGHAFTIGRQRSGEPKAPAWIEEQGRLVVVNSNDRVISREQARILRKRLSEIELVNASGATPFFWGDQQLAPGESVNLNLPITIVVGELQIVIRFEDEMMTDGSMRHHE